MQIARAMQVTGYSLWLIASLVPFCHPDVHLLRYPTWLLAYGIFGVALHFGASVSTDTAHRTRRLLALSVLTPAMIAMAAIMPCAFGALTLVVVASQVALVLSPRASLAWCIAQTLILARFLIPELGWSQGLAELIALFGFQGFALIAIMSARRESEARLALVQTNAELQAMRSLLNDTCRAQERERIARDLHDALGHSLTALSLQLQIASLVEEDAARQQVAKARELTDRLLGDVREVVGKMRAAHPSRLVTAIRALVVDVPGLTLHLDVPESLIVDEPSRVECVVRCVQELVTNTRRHAQAENLWIRLRRERDEILIEAHDDGSAAEALADGHGLRGMRARFQEMGGWLDVHRAPECAFAISGCLPIRTTVGGTR